MCIFIYTYTPRISREARIEKFELDEGFQSYHPPSDFKSSRLPEARPAFLYSICETTTTTTTTTTTPATTTTTTTIMSIIVDITKPAANRSKGSFSCARDVLAHGGFRNGRQPEYPRTHMSLSSLSYLSILRDKAE